MTTTDRKLRVFLSYAKEDFKSVHEIYVRLKGEGWIEPWQDKNELLPGEHWTAAIKRAIDVADAVIVFLSDNSINKEGFVHYEMNYAWDRSLQKPPGTIYRIPIRLDNCDVPEDLYELDSRQWVDYFGEKKDETYEKLLKALQRRHEQKKQLEAKEQARAEILAKKQDKDKPRLKTEERARKEREEQEREEADEKARIEAEEKARKAKAEQDRIAAQAERDRLKQQKVEERKKAWVETLRKINFKPILTVGGIVIAVFALFFVGRLILDDLPDSPIPTMTVTSQMTVSVPTPTETQSLPINTLEPPTVTPTPALGIGSTQVSDKDGMTLLYVPAGEFTMGSNDSGYTNQKPTHTVYLDAFWIDQTEVTNAMYTKCVDVGKCTPPSNTNHFANISYANHPVNYISSWSDASAYCAWVGRKLPTEAEWEKAARGTDGRIYPWGNDAPNSDLLNYNGEIGETTEVKKYPNGVSPYGAYDMAGNVWEYVSDLFSNTYYQNSPASNPLGPDSGQYRVLRGGSWYHLDIDDTHLVRSTFRLRITPGDVFGTIGFRCASSP